MGRASAGLQWLPDFKSYFVNGMDSFVNGIESFLFLVILKCLKMQNLKFGQSFRWTAVAAQFQIIFCKWYGYFRKWYRKFIVFGNFSVWKCRAPAGLQWTPDFKYKFYVNKKYFFNSLYRLFIKKMLLNCDYF